MDSEDFFKDPDFIKKWKGKSGIYIIEQPLFTKSIGYPVYNVGYARNSLYTRIADYRTAYGLVPYKIHAIYAIPQKVIGKHVNYAHLTERVLQETARQNGDYSGVGEWFEGKARLLKILFTIRKKHEKEIKDANKWEFYTFDLQRTRLGKIKLVDENDITGRFKDLKAGRITRSGDNEVEGVYEAVVKD